MTNIYDLHDKAFNRVSAYVVTDATGRLVARVAFKFPADGAGRLFCYFHVLGMPMVRAYAGGYGYDKKSAAAEAAAERITGYAEPSIISAAETIKSALAQPSGIDWDRRLKSAGFTVHQAV